MTASIVSALVLLFFFSMGLHHWLSLHWMELPSWSTPVSTREVANGQKQSLIVTAVFDLLAIVFAQAVLERLYRNTRQRLRMK